MSAPAGQPLVMKVTDPLAGFIAGSRWEDVPGHVRHEAKRALLNYFAVALAGCRDPAIEAAAEVFAQFSAGSQATLIGRGSRSDPLTCAALNAMSANVHDFDDTHVPTIIHPSAPVAPALFAAAQRWSASGSALLHAFILGVEVECRIGNAVSPGHYARGWHITSTCGVFGAAAGVGKLLGLTSRQLAWAIGNASSQSSGLVETLGSMAKSFGVGSAARNGVLSALLARAGFEGPSLPLEGPRGFLQVTAERPDGASILDSLGERWELLANTYKPYPCGVVLNPVIEACLGLSGHDGLRLEAIDRIDLYGNPLLRQRTDRPHVTTGREAQVSAQHAVAAVLINGKAGLGEFSDAMTIDPRVRALGAKVFLTEDPACSIEAARLKVTLRDRSITGAVDVAKGGLGKPLSDADIEAKFRELCEFSQVSCSPQRLIDAVWSLDTAESAGDLMTMVAGNA